MDTYINIGIQIPRLLLPRSDIDLKKWAVIACDQFTSQPEYWHQVEQFVGSAPSTLHLIMPEIYLGKSKENERIQGIQASMRQYLDNGTFDQYDGMIYVEREVYHQIRRGLLLCLDLEQYDYHQSSQSLARATEGTILERIPPRMRVRQAATLELPHILVLIDDPEHTVIEPTSLAKGKLTRLYDFDLMLGGGHLAGYLVNRPEEQARIIHALEVLNLPETFARKYQPGSGQKPFLFAIGDGNHSLAAAKANWEQMKANVGMEHPARYALVEIVNLHDRALAFEPIHRVLFGVKENIPDALKAYFQGQVKINPCSDIQRLTDTIAQTDRERQMVGLITAQGITAIEIKRPLSNLTVGTLQAFLDEFVKAGQAKAVDYLHGEDVLLEMSSQPMNAGFLLPGLNKNELFRSVILDGVLPRKTFSIGKALAKRFYMECRSIT